MAKHLNRRDINYILNSITEWNMKGEKLTWDNLCKKVSEDRQNSYKAILIYTQRNRKFIHG